MDVNDMTFGVEFEVTMPYAKCPVVGSYSSGYPIHGLPAGWVAKSDGSIRAGRGYNGVEIVSPILRGADGIWQIKTVCEWLNQKGARVNRSTGFHVHVGWTGDDAALKSLVHLMAQHEPAFIAATGTQARANNRFCQPIAGHPGFIASFRDGTASIQLNRYHTLNVTNVGNAAKKTVEFRVFAGTTNATKALGYLRMCLGLVEKAMTTKRMPTWTAKAPVATSPIHRKGDGLTAITRFLYAMGWTKGRTPHTYGNLNAEGCPEIGACKRVIQKMARKFDRGQGE